MLTAQVGRRTGISEPFRIVDAHHGEITVSNRSGGCRFTVRLPVSQA